MVGIRPGEKLHEAMVTVDDAPQTYDLGDRYVIEPSFALADRQGFKDRGGRLVPEDFSYTSERNDSWLGNAELKALVADTVVSV